MRGTLVCNTRAPLPPSLALGAEVRIAVIIPTYGRAECTREVVALLARQTRRPDRVLIVGVRDEDIAGVGPVDGLSVEAMTWTQGSSAQRNRGLDLAEQDCDIAWFLDDDYAPSADYCERVERLFAEHADLAGITGRMIFDGVHGPGISFAEAQRLIDADRPQEPRFEPRRALYGCNMAIRLGMARGIRFDERLPLYGWQEDIDYTYQVGRNGRNALATELRGVHLGVKRGRTSGKRFGYSQVANPVYLLGKQTIPRDRAYKIMWRNVAGNALRSLRPEPHIDRRGRLLGNLIALKDVMLGRSAPERCLEL